MIEHAPTTATQIIDDLTGLLNSFGAGLQDDVALLAIGIPPITGTAT